jgi:hypothetical protein
MRFKDTSVVLWRRERERERGRRQEEERKNDLNKTISLQF